MFSFSLLLALGTADAQQTLFDSQANGTETAFSYQWMDHAGRQQSVEFSLPTDAIDKDRAVPLDLSWAEMDAFVTQELNAWSDTQPDIEIEVKSNDSGRMALTAYAEKPLLKQAFEDAWDQMNAAEDKWADANGYVRLSENEFLEDHAKLAREYATSLAPVAQALASEASSPREFAERTMNFLQSIPYDSRTLGRDIGYRRPLATLAENRADCDSKSVVMLALMRAAYPDVEAAVVNIPGHTFVAVEVERLPGDLTIDSGGKTWVTADPVGPAVHELGILSRRSWRMIRRGRHDLRPIAPAGP